MEKIANNETLERIEQEAWEKSDPVEGSGCRKGDHSHDCGCSDWEAGYAAGAISERDKAIDEAIETVAKIEFIDRNPANVISDVIKQLSKLRS